MDNDIQSKILSAVEKRFDEQTDFLCELTSHPSTRGNEQSAQDLMARAMAERGYEVDRWQVDVKDIEHLPGFSPVIGNYDDAVNVVGTHSSSSRKGRSLILNGHIDVVPEGPLEMWERPPYEPWKDGDWLYGRGAGDMKAGLVANLYALDAIRDAGFAPAADVFVQSVVEEECTGNGALACLQRGYRADAALIPEPFAETLTIAQIGVIWFQVHLKGLPVHVLEAGSGSNAIEASIPLIAALHELEARWNRPEKKHACYCGIDHPINLNIGKIQGGDWTSSVPAWCCFDVRIAIYPGQDINEAKAEIEAVLNEAANKHPFLKKNRPEITYHGFLAEGYALAEHQGEAAGAAIATLEDVHKQVTGTDLEKIAVTATTDARFFGLYMDTPALVYGPKAEAIHGFNERVDLQSVRRNTQTIAMFIAQWCGLEKL
ncbi:ArgE/DapE family deacylase [Rhodobacteraceae bacterium RKSG542]|uniref:ArgE/DapE family deacylase n=1 Tax=Pseudovibrio flavus TaxID=2529854 RepID=UPI0012BC5087|nr:ArgE/DapE family deacylase [Pseudovibrio flavus]MTI16434.1 ArgE/DapE family deacylase [Pseudovibrio flavus]